MIGKAIEALAALEMERSLLESMLSDRQDADEINRILRDMKSQITSIDKTLKTIEDRLRNLLKRNPVSATDDKDGGEFVTASESSLNGGTKHCKICYFFSENENEVIRHVESFHFWQYMKCPIPHCAFEGNSYAEYTYHFAENHRELLRPRPM